MRHAVITLKSGQIVLHAKALLCIPTTAIRSNRLFSIQKLIRVDVTRVHVNKGYRSHNYLNRFMVAETFRLQWHNHHLAAGEVKL